MNMPHWLRRLLRHVFRDFRDLEAQAALAFIDHLTGLYNRRGMMERLAGVVNLMAHQVRQEGEHRRFPTIGVVFIDIDHFKRINDHYGHPTGDLVLAELARRLRRMPLRDGDFVVRLGGEELAVVLPQADAITARDKAEMILGLIRGDAFATTHPYQSITVTVSAGTTALPILSHMTGEATWQLLADQADRALYAAKRRGRDQVITFTPDLPAHPGHKE